MCKNWMKKPFSSALIFILVWNTLSFGSEYLIKEGDVLKIVVMQRKDISQTVPVAPDGTISIPLIDEVQVSGLTVREIDEKITEKLTLFIEDPEGFIFDFSIWKIYLIYIYRFFIQDFRGIDYGEDL